MKIKKVINNNLVKTQNEKKQELLVMGCGLGFQKHAGDVIDESKIEHIYIESDLHQANKLETLLSRIPLEYIQTANEIVSYARLSLGKKLDDNIYITLTDHIAYAIERAQKGIYVKNALLWEIRRFYNHEYLVAIHALEIISNRLGIQLQEDEAGFITLHLVSASMSDMNPGTTTEMTKVIQEILGIVKYHFKVELDEYSLHYERFLTHLKFFVQRVFTDTEINDNEEGFLEAIRDQYKKEYQCALKVRRFMQKEYEKELTEDELIYLTVHMRRVTQKN